MWKMLSITFRCYFRYSTANRQLRAGEFYCLLATRMWETLHLGFTNLKKYAKCSANDKQEYSPGICRNLIYYGQQAAKDRGILADLTLYGQQAARMGWRCILLCTLRLDKLHVSVENVTKDTHPVSIGSDHVLPATITSDHNIYKH